MIDCVKCHKVHERNGSAGNELKLKMQRTMREKKSLI